MSALGEKAFILSLTDSESVGVMLKEGVDPKIIPTTAFRGVYQWATTYYRQGGGVAPTAEVLVERFGVDFWADHGVYIAEDPEETVEWAIEDLKQTFIQKEVGSFAKKLATEVATSTPEERTATAASLASELNALVQSIQPRTTHMDMRESGEDLLSEYEEILTHKGSVRGMAFGLPQIDQHLGGIWPGELAIMGGPAGTGKSFFADWVAYKEWERGRNVVLFTLENSILMTQMRIACQALQMSIGDLQTGTLADHEYEQLQEWCKDVLEKSDNPLHISSPISSLRTPQSIVEISRAHEAESLIVDQLTFMHPNDRHDQRHREIAVMLHDLKEMISIGRDPLPCLLLHQISREGVRAAARTGRLDMTHMAEGSEVERTGDHVMSLYQSEEFRTMGRMQIQGLKHRRVEPQSWDLQWAPYSGIINVLNEVIWDD